MINNDDISIGVDIISIKRFEHKINRSKNRFFERIFTKKEIHQCLKKNMNHSVCFAGKFAAKEAVFKSLKYYWKRGVNWKDIEIINETKGYPMVKLYGEILEYANEKNINHIQITISHNSEYAIAFAMALKG